MRVRKPVRAQQALLLHRTLLLFLLSEHQQRLTPSMITLARFWSANGGDEPTTGAMAKLGGGVQGLISNNFFVTLTSVNPFLPIKCPCSPSAQFCDAPHGDCIPPVARLRACLAKMGPFRWATVSGAKMTSPF